MPKMSAVPPWIPDDHTPRPASADPLILADEGVAGVANALEGSADHDGMANHEFN